MTVRILAALVVLAGLQSPTFRAELRLVVMRVSVLNGHGEIVTSLSEPAFSIFEDGKRQAIRAFSRDDVPVSVGILVDNSGSMRPVRPKVEAGAMAFAEASHQADELFAINFADRPHLDVPMTTDRALLARGLARIDAVGGTALRDAIDEAESYLRRHATRDRRALLILTDGVDNESDATLDRVTRVAEEQEVVVYAIGLFGGPGSEKAGRRDLDRLTKSTGGVAYYPSSVDGVRAAALSIADQIRRQYTLAYAPTNQRLDGTYRHIAVNVHGQEHYLVRTRPGYYATR
jgi:VWFA-related protein